MKNSHKSKIESFIGSLSRAVGNELIDFNKEDDKTIILMWPPISLDNSVLIKSMARSMIPERRLKVNRKAGRITVS